MTCPTIVAECGVAHGGDLARALLLASVAMNSGADIAKFQAFVPDLLMRRSDPDFDKLTPLALPLSDFKRLAAHCAEIGIEFCATPGDVMSLRYLVEDCKVRRIKIGSDDLTNVTLLRAAKAYKLPVVLSTGMATMIEIGAALSLLTGCEVTLLQCTSLYPCPPSLVNLKAMYDLQLFGHPVGYSDHTMGGTAAVLAAALGAVMIEKHLMLADGPASVDAEVSITGPQFRVMVHKIGHALTMLGDGRKNPSDIERARATELRKGRDGKRGGWKP